MATTLLEMRGITKTFPGVKALQNVTLEVETGEVHAICGENGAGKSTLMKVLSGVYPHGTYEGEIVFEGREMNFRTLRDSEAEGIVIIHQELALSPHLSIAENIFLNNEEDYDNGVKIVPSYLLQPVIVVKDNITQELVDSGYWTEDEING